MSVTKRVLLFVVCGDRRARVRRRGGRRRRRREGRLHGRAHVNDFDSLNPIVGRRGPRLRGLEPPVRDADRQGGGRLRHDPRPRRVVGGLERRQDVHVHAARRARRGRTARRSPPRTSPTRSTARARRSGSTTTRPSTNLTAKAIDDTHRRDRELGARPEAADDGRLHPPEAHLGEARRQGRSTKYPAHDGVGSGPFTLVECKRGQFVAA